MDEIIGHVAQRIGVRAEDITGRSKDRRFVEARRRVVRLARRLRPMSWPEIGAAIGRAHNTAMAMDRPREYRR